MPSIQSVIEVAPELDTQLLIVATFAIFFYFTVPTLSKNVIVPFVKSRPWCSQFVNLNRQAGEKSFNVVFDSEESALETSCLMVSVLFQHLLGGALCVPALLYGPGEYRSSMACVGALCETGWEVQDLTVRLYWHMCGINQAINPKPLLLLMIIHHTMGMALVIPMNLYYRDNPMYHELVFLLQGAAFAAFMCTYYGYTLNMKTVAGLRQMKVIAIFTWIVVLWTRVLRYWWITYTLMIDVYADGNMKMIFVGGGATVLMGIFNMLLFLDASHKLVKFVPMSTTSEDVEHAGVAVSRSSHHRLSFTVVDATTGRKKWAKVRGAVMMGVIKESTNIDDASKKEN